MKKILSFLVLGLLAGFAPLAAREVPKSSLASYQPWSPGTVHTFENMLVQQDGRVKPFYTVARFALLQFLGKSRVSFATQDGETHRLHYSEWLLDVLFRGEVAKELPVFIVDNSEVIVTIGVSPKSKRDRYSYSELLPGRERLASLAAQFAEKQKQYEESEKDPKFLLEPVESMILTLGRNVSSFEYLIAQFGFARQGELLVNAQILPPELNQLAQRLDTIEMIDKMPEMSLDQLVGAIRQEPGSTEEERLFTGALRLLFFHASSGRGLSLIPPQAKDDEVWLSGGDLLLAGLESKEKRPWAQEQLGKLRTMVRAANDPAAFEKALQEFSAAQRQIAAERGLGEGARSAMEVDLYRGFGGFSWFTWSLITFVLAFIVLAFSWLTPGSRIGATLLLIAGILAFVGLAFDTYGITLRSLIRHRPPITNLYDTVLFITATAVLLGLILEWLTRFGIGTFIAVISGLLGMFLAMKYEAKEATDTIGQLQAVLDTNFWLATHVTIINIGYAAGLVAAIIGIVYLTGRFVGHFTGRENKAFYQGLTRMNYGVVCFCLFFSLVGTVLGGIWANYSWGRFWGWDPKENGALMICLWTLVILHGRFAGWIREIGVHTNAIFLAIIVTFSWWGVNNLGVGLHSYGFTEGVWGALYSSWVFLAIFMAMGIFLWITERGARQARRADASAKAVTA